MTTWELLAAWAEFLLGIFGQRLLVRGVPPLDDIGDSLEGRTVIITGPTSGIGKSTAGALVRKGANVVLACRNPERGNELRQALLSNAKKLKGEGEGHASKGENGPSVEVMQLDIANPDSVRSFVESWKASGKAVHVLINNAGVFQMGVASRQTTASGHELHFATNYLGPFYLTLGLLSSLRKGAQQKGEARIVNVSSSSHMLTSMAMDDLMLGRPGAYSSARAYKQSKLAMNLFTCELRRRLDETSGISAFVLHPGTVVTDVARTLPGLIVWLYKSVVAYMLLTSDEGARCTMHCASSREAVSEAKRTLGYFDSSCRPVMPSRHAQSVEMARWLWQETVRITQLPNEYDLAPL
eukprot:evm.model.scf_37.10 EVM.evm.TU.scf_37.10   scf_37:74710-78545(+)